MEIRTVLFKLLLSYVSNVFNNGNKAIMFA